MQEPWLTDEEERVLRELVDATDPDAAWRALSEYFEQRSTPDKPILRPKLLYETEGFNLTQWQVEEIKENLEGKGFVGFRSGRLVLLSPGRSYFRMKERIGEESSALLKRAILAAALEETTKGTIRAFLRSLGAAR